MLAIADNYMIKHAVIDPDMSRLAIQDLAAGILKQAVIDLKSEQLPVKLDALLFMASDDLPLYLAAALDDDETNFDDAGIRLLTSPGRSRKLDKVVRSMR